ncbi:MAG: hypothetical protein Q9207_002573 [Kuettlingeria erythrocarpa]
MSDRAFASLTPVNVLAKLAFSDLYDKLTAGRQNSQADGVSARHRMAVVPQQIVDSDVLRFRFEEERRVSSQNAYSSDAETSESLTEPNTDTESQHQELGMIWTGRYLLALESLPSVPNWGYTVGKGSLENTPFDLLPLHASLYVAGCSSSQSAQLTINGEVATRRPYHLNQHSMKIRLDKLEYDFKWTEFAATDDFKKDRNRYVTSVLGGPQFVDVDIPTPLPNTRTIGGWTLGDPLGVGGHSRVFFASNALGDMAAIKMIERTSKNYRNVDAEIEVCKEVTAFAKQSEDGERILRATEFIYSNEEKFSSKRAFDNVAVVLWPMTPQTLADLVGVRSKGGAKGMTMEAAIVFRDALVGLRFMHDGHWLHHDMKPTNIGLVGSPLRSVLLDVGTSARIQLGMALQPEPGTRGTVGYLAPELELKEYDFSIDIWAMGVILYELTYGYHPWKFTLNPWREGKKYEMLRPAFRESHRIAVDRMGRDYDMARRSPAVGFIHLGGLFIEMVSTRPGAHCYPTLSKPIAAMTSQQEKPCTITASQYQPINFLDIVATQGAYLVPRAATPVWEKPPDEEFAATLYREIHSLTVVQKGRRNMYRQAAEEWPIGRTPPEVKEQRDAELKVLLDREGITSDSSGDSDNGDDAAGGRASLAEGVVTAADRPHPPPQAHSLLTPPLSAHGPLSASHGRKRRRISGANKENNREMKRPRKTLPNSTTTGLSENALRNGSQGISRKRRRSGDINNNEADNMERLIKTHVSATRTSRRLQPCQPRRSGAG